MVIVLSSMSFLERSDNTFFFCNITIPFLINENNRNGYHMSLLCNQASLFTTVISCHMSSIKTQRHKDRYTKCSSAFHSIN